MKDTIRARCVGIEVNTETREDFKVTLESQDIDISQLDEWKQALAKWIDLECRY